MVKIDKDRCIGCGICVNICPEGFVVEGGIAQVKDETADCIREAARECPKVAIIRDGFQEDRNKGTRGLGQRMGQGRGMEGGSGRRMGRGKGQGRGLGNRWR